MNGAVRNKGGPSRLTSKPLCDCIECTCRECPDIMKLLSISLNESACDITTKTKKRKESRNRGIASSNRSSIPSRIAMKKDVMYDHQINKDCVCEAVARSLKSGIQNNINLDDSGKHHSSGHDKENKTTYG